jgi:hypothetical protein
VYGASDRDCDEVGRQLVLALFFMLLPFDLSLSSFLTFKLYTWVFLENGP